MSDIASVLAKLLPLVGAQAPGVAKSLKPGLSHDQLSRFELDLGVSLPQEWKEVYSTFDGQPAWGETLLPQLRSDLAPLIVMESSTVLAVYRDRLSFMRDMPAINQMKFTADGPIKLQYWSPKWIPFASDGGAGMLAIDLDPAAEGKVGQLFSVWDDSYHRVVLADSLTHLLESLYSRLSEGRAQYREGYGLC